MTTRYEINEPGAYAPPALSFVVVVDGTCRRVWRRYETHDAAAAVAATLQKHGLKAKVERDG